MPISTADFETLASLVRQRSAIVLTPDKEYLLETRLQPLLREHGMAMKEALIQASSQRLRPILMTSIAFILGVLPLVIGSGPAGQRAAIQASKLGKSVLLIERQAVVGGATDAVERIVERFTAIGLSPVMGAFVHPFTFTRMTMGGRQEGEGANVLAMCVGKDPKLPYYVVSSHYDHLGIRDCQRVVALELRLGTRVFHSAAHLEFGCRACAFALALHRRLEAGVVNMHIAFARDVSSQIHRKTECVIQLEHGVAVEHLVFAR